MASLPCKWGEAASRCNTNALLKNSGTHVDAHRRRSVRTRTVLSPKVRPRSFLRICAASFRADAESARAACSRMPLTSACRGRRLFRARIFKRSTSVRSSPRISISPIASLLRSKSRVCEHNDSTFATQWQHPSPLDRNSHLGPTHSRFPSRCRGLAWRMGSVGSLE